jgi:hypothetical protein
MKFGQKEHAYSDKSGPNHTVNVAFCNLGKKLFTHGAFKK